MATKIRIRPSLLSLMVLLVWLLLLNSTPVAAQRNVDLAVKAGISIPNLTSGTSNDPISNGYSSRLAFDASVAAEWHLTKKFSLQPQLEYSQQGGKKNGVQAFTVPPELAAAMPPGQAYLYANYKSTAKMNYLMLPLLAKFHQNIGTRWQPYFAVGPFISLLLSAHNTTSGSSLVYLDEKQTQPLTTEPMSFNSKDDVKESLYGWNAGVSGHVGLAYALQYGWLFVEGGGNYGLKNIQKDAINGKNKTGAAVINIGYQFRL